MRRFESCRGRVSKVPRFAARTPAPTPLDRDEPRASGRQRLRRDLRQPAVRAASGDTIPRWRIPDDEMLPETAYQIIHDELFLDGNARQNLATFVTTWMEPEATQLYMEAFDKNMIDKDEYPQTAAIEERCLHILADLWNAPDPHATIGTSAIGSSEACMLGRSRVQAPLAERAPSRGQVDRESPNIVFSSAVQVVWEKFANYWEVEPRYVPITKEQPYLTAEGMLAAVDENTIGVVADPRRHLQRRVRTREGARRRARRSRGPHRSRRSAARRRGVGRFHRAVPRPASRVGLPRAARALDQRLGPQVRARLPGPRMDRVGPSAVPARGARLQRQLPRWRTCRRSR